MVKKEEVAAAMLRKIRDSALTARDAEQLGFTPYLPAELAARPELGIQWVQQPGFLIPYYNLDGKPTQFFRFRQLADLLPKNGFAALTNGNGLSYKYAQPAGMTPQVYFAPLFPWKEYLDRAPEDAPVIITEGELKAACGCKYEFPVLGLGGVSSFMSARKGIDLLPELDAINFKKRRTVILFDSDAVTNPDVLRAANMLARRLLSREAELKVMWLPSPSLQKKVGLDDFLVAKGEKPFIKLLKDAEDWAPSAALHEFNEEVIFLREGAVVLDPRQRHRWRAAEAVNYVYKNRKYTVSETRNGKLVMATKFTAKEWVEWPGRTQLEGVTYRPGAPPVIDCRWNGWQGWGLPDAVIKKGPVDPWKQLLDFLFSSHDKAHRTWFEQWLAYPLQHPGVKMFTAAVLWGGPGVGKTLIGSTMRRIYGMNWVKVTERELHSTFNEWAEYKQFAMGEEITGGDKRGVADYLKDLITQEELRINPKHIKAYTVPDCMNWYFTSNHPDAFFIEDKDRRFFVIEVRQEQPLERSFYKSFDKWFKEDEGAGALFYHLLHVDLTGFDPLSPAPVTLSKLEMIADGRSDVGAWCAELKENPDAVLREHRRQLWTTAELFALYKGQRPQDTRLTQNGLGRELKRAGVAKALHGAPFGWGNPVKTVRAWIVRDVAALKLKNPAQLGALYGAEFERWERLQANAKKEKF